MFTECAFVILRHDVLFDCDFVCVCVCVCAVFPRPLRKMTVGMVLAALAFVAAALLQIQIDVSNRYLAV